MAILVEFLLITKIIFLSMDEKITFIKMHDAENKANPPSTLLLLLLLLFFHFFHFFYFSLYIITN